MDCFKKNPEIKDEFVCVQGKMIGDDDVVCGKEFEPFSNPATFPGKTPKLVRSSINELNSKQKDSAVKSIKEQVEKPPRHLGVITSDQIGKNLKGGGKDGNEMMKISSQADVKQNVVEKAKKAAEVTRKISGGPKKLGVDIATAEVVEMFPGVTDKNVEKFIGLFNTVEEVAAASNIEMRKSGVSSSFYRRLREKAQKILSEGK